MAPPLKSYEETLEHCRQRGMRLSKQRQLILKLLWETEEHLPASVIYDRLRQQGKNIGHTSVYQNLDALSKAGVIERLEKAEGCLYSHKTCCHAHVQCLDDGRIIDVTVTLPPELIAAIEAQLDLQIIDYRIEFFAQTSKGTYGS
jgi:Fur family ferric uptake transcriptional regulator